MTQITSYVPHANIRLIKSTPVNLNNPCSEVKVVSTSSIYIQSDFPQSLRDIHNSPRTQLRRCEDKKKCPKNDRVLTISHQSSRKHMRAHISQTGVTEALIFHARITRISRAASQRTFSSLPRLVYIRYQSRRAPRMHRAADKSALQAD